MLKLLCWSWTTRACTIIMYDSLYVALVWIVHRHPIHPGFMCLKELCLAIPQNFVQDAKCLGVFPIRKNSTFSTMCTNILTYSWWEISSVEVRQPSTIQWEEGVWEAEEEVYTSYCRACTETMKSEEWIWKLKLVREQCVSLSNILLCII